eukprot:9970315-Alexandrium_andersonii.AAC.1
MGGECGESREGAVYAEFRGFAIALGPLSADGEAWVKKLVESLDTECCASDGGGVAALVHIDSSGP